jgi:hypothetical protein
MNKPETLTLAHRKTLVDMLGQYSDLRSKARSRSTERRYNSSSAFIQELGKAKGAPELVAEIERARLEIEKTTQKLDLLGFQLDRDSYLSFSSHAPKTFHTNLRKRLEEEFGPETEVNDRFDQAIVKIWTAPTLEEAQKIVQQLL